MLDSIIATFENALYFNVADAAVIDLCPTLPALVVLTMALVSVEGRGVVCRCGVKHTAPGVQEKIRISHKKMPDYHS